MIIDRSKNDVDQALSIIRQKVQKFQELTEDELETLRRGCTTVETWNRIENKTKELHSIISSMLYSVGEINTKNWTNKNVFFAEDFERILSNIEKLKKGFFVYENTPQTPPPRLDYMVFNDMEKILFDLENYVADVVDKYKICGSAVCGE